MPRARDGHGDEDECVGAETNADGVYGMRGICRNTTQEVTQIRDRFAKVLE